MISPRRSVSVPYYWEYSGTSQIVQYSNKDRMVSNLYNCFLESFPDLNRQNIKNGKAQRNIKKEKEVFLEYESLFNLGSVTRAEEGLDLTEQ